MNFLQYIIPILAHAEDGMTSGKGPSSAGSGSGITLTNPLAGNGITSIPAFLEKLSSYAIFYIAPPIVTMFVIYGAFQILTSQGDAEKYKSGIKTIVYAALGYGLILLSWGILSLINELLLGT